MQDIKMKGELDRHTQFLLPTISLSSAEQNKNVVVGCFAVAVITIWKQYVVSTEHVLMVTGLSVEFFSNI